MQPKSLIFVFTLATASLSSVLGAGPINDDYESLKSCVSGNSKSCPDFKHLYPDEAHYKQHEETLISCLKKKRMPAKNGRTT